MIIRIPPSRSTSGGISAQVAKVMALARADFSFELTLQLFFTLKSIILSITDYLC
jgi:hypothetical protein